ncbi:MAG: hypothetical protein E7406_01775 [Ruminococcaceae bacterium]|nr:hypothetical protein [Oscillospiraceae bacterium]
MSNRFDPDKDYMEEMKRSAAAGDEAGFNSAQTARNRKIDATGSGYARTNYTMKDFAKQNGITSVPAVRVPANPYPGRMWDAETDHAQESINSVKRGDIPGAMYHEKMHNDKDGALGLGYGASGYWNYLDKQGLGGLREGKLREIEDYFGKDFEYDYRDDERYQAIRRLKEKEADKAYEDGYAALSRQFDGDIPVNMINKLLTTKGEIIDQADSYIPTLEQIARDMYYNKGNQLYSQYGLLNNLVQEDKQDFYTDRDFVAQGVMNNYNNRKSDEATRYNALMDLAAMYYNDDPTINWDEAMKRARSSDYI